MTVDKAPEGVNVSVVIPCYNEEKRLQPALDRALDRLETIFGEPFELLFVNDGSTDGTEGILRKAVSGRGRIRAVILSYKDNRGKGGAVREGVLNSAGKKIIVMDADFSIDLDEVPKALKMLDSSDVVVGTKKHTLSRSVRPQKLPRRIMGKAFTMLTNSVLGMDFTDITCGFKGFGSEAARDIFKRQVMKGWSYDSETLFLATKLGYRCTEIPVQWHHIEGSKVSPVYDSIRAARDLCSIMVNYYTGRYGGKNAK